jgi:hypothetical protein
MACDIWLVFFTAILAISTTLLWITTCKSIKIVKKEFIANHPPKLKMHTIIFTYEPIPTFNTDKNDIDTSKWNIQCLVSNIGGSLATIKECKMTFKKIKEPFPVILPFSDEFPHIEKPLIKSGEYSVCSIHQFDKETIETVLFHQTSFMGGASREKINDLYFFGYIDYTDNNGTVRHTAFCRQYNFAAKCFIKIDNEDYEYGY